MKTKSEEIIELLINLDKTVEDLATHEADYPQIIAYANARKKILEFVTKLIEKP